MSNLAYDYWILVIHYDSVDYHSRNFLWIITQLIYVIFMGAYINMFSLDIYISPCHCLLSSKHSMIAGQTALWIRTQISLLRVAVQHLPFEPNESNLGGDTLKHISKRRVPVLQVTVLQMSHM